MEETVRRMKLRISLRSVLCQQAVFEGGGSLEFFQVPRPYIEERSEFFIVLGIWRKMKDIWKTSSYFSHISSYFLLILHIFHIFLYIFSYFPHFLHISLLNPIFRGWDVYSRISNSSPGSRADNFSSPLDISSKTIPPNMTSLTRGEGGVLTDFQ